MSMYTLLEQKHFHYEEDQMKDGVKEKRRSEEVSCRRNFSRRKPKTLCFEEKVV